MSKYTVGLSHIKKCPKYTVVLSHIKIIILILFRYISKNILITDGVHKEIQIYFLNSMVLSNEIKVS